MKSPVANSIDIAHKMHYNSSALKGGSVMAESTNITFRMDKELKDDFSSFCDDLGITMSAAFTMFAKKAVRERRIPFELSTDPFYSEANIAELERRISNIRSGKSTLKEHDLIEEAL